MSTYVRAELFFSGQHARSGLRIIDRVTAPVTSADDVPLLAMRGALCTRAAVLAAHAGMPDEASDRIAEAQAIARQVPETIRVLIRSSRKPPPPLTQLATWIGHP